MSEVTPLADLAQADQRIGLAFAAPPAKTAPMSSFRMPQSLNARLGVETGEAVFRHELLEEQAQSLGRAGRKVEAALVALAAHEGEQRAAAVKTAADAVWEFLVQREVMGLRDRNAVVAEYRIPREVMARIGAR
ncbi:DUF6665 family protein [Phenylobacterium sp.]|uniref:DUF6665 family protein n=1 Tax=Phenylobacterium sp. TaxID=1871053 RepID=UPI00286E60F2|nr:DUF6665 family protein [Phenylobacterium sp.]